MNKKLFYAKSDGQSIPVLALILVVLFGMAALALDVGNTYAEQREVVRATNAAALEAMDAVNNNLSDSKVRERIYNSLQSHNIPVAMDSTAPGLMNVEAYYFNASGKRECEGQIGSCANINREKVSYVRVAVDGKVDTYFARLVGRPDLPVNAVAHAGSSICQEGMYPIAIDQTTLDEEKDKWLDEDRLYSDEIYKKLSVRRVNMIENGNPGNFGYMRWDASNQSDGSATWLADALTPPGKVSNYVEADWPDDTERTKPDGYPIMPKQMNTGDWIAGNSGLSNKVAKSGGSGKDDYDPAGQSKIEYLIKNRVILNLPLYDETLGNGNNSVYHLSGVGAFLLLDYGHTSKDGWYMDLAYIGKGKECVGLMTGTVENRTVTLEGNVSLYPHFRDDTEAKDVPVQLLIVLDTSGSMAYNFAGYAYKNGEKVLCQGTDAKVCVGDGYEWNVASERRINIAVKVLKEMIQNKLREQDRVRIVTYHSTFGDYDDNKGKVIPDNVILDSLTTVAPETGIGPEGDGWTNDRSIILGALDDVLGMSIKGETPSAIGLARALQVYRNSVTYIPGTSQPYKRSIIFMTDGLANVTRTGFWHRCRDSITNDYTVDTISCQSDRNDPDGMLDSNTEYPINAMNVEGDSLNSMIKGIENGKGSIHAVAIGPTGDMIGDSLARISSNNHASTAENEEELRKELEAIFEAAITYPCEDGVIYKNSPTTVIEYDNLPLGVEDFPQAANGVVGYVKLKSLTTSWSGEAPIQWDDSTKKLSYRMESIPPGDYNLTYWMMYRGEDGVVRLYNVALSSENSSSGGVSSQTITLKADTDVIGSVVKNLVLDIETGTNVCMDKTTP